MRKQESRRIEKVGGHWIWGLMEVGEWWASGGRVTQLVGDYEWAGGFLSATSEGAPGGASGGEEVPDHQTAPDGTGLQQGE